MDNLGEDFSVPVDHGVIEPKAEFALHMDFRAIRPTNVKRIVRLEVIIFCGILNSLHLFTCLRDSMHRKSKPIYICHIIACY